MKVLAFLQNQWFPGNSAKRMARLYELHGTDLDERADMNARYLFFRCLTGRRLKKVFGDQWCNDIVWENASPRIGDAANCVFPPDTEHMKKVIAHHKPAVILGFGKQAAHGIELVNPKLLRMLGPHPAARGSSTIPLLKSMREFLDDIARQRDPL